VLFAFILLYFFLFTFTALSASLTVVRKRTDYTRNESSREHLLPGTKVSSREHSFPRAKVPCNFRSEERKYRGAKTPDTVHLTVDDIPKLHAGSISFFFHFHSFLLMFVNVLPISTLCVADMVHVVADDVCGRYRF